jgi:methylenetetrahydrofolate reductase (NADH)
MASSLDTAHLAPEQVAAIRRVLASPKYEVIPLAKVTEQLGFLPEGATVSVTASPTKGMGATIDLTLDLRSRGFDAIPHLSARVTRDRDELGVILDRLARGEVTKAFVVGGDGDQKGEFSDALALLGAMEEMGHGLTEIGVAGYPEGHHIVDGPTIARALEDKAPFASYVTTQMCFAPKVTSHWVRKLRAGGIGLGVYIGVPGVAELKKLITLSLRIGVGASSRFLSHNKSLAGRLVRPGGYSPDNLILGLAPLLADPAANVLGLHLFTFNQIESTEEWRQQMLEELL